MAAASGSTEAAALRIERGAEVDAVESDWGNTPLDTAVYHQELHMIDLLSHVSRDVWNLVFAGKVERLRVVLSAEPDLTKSINKSGETLLMWLPDDEARAIEIVKLLLVHGTDPRIRDKNGMTAEEWARKRGLDEAAELLRLTTR